MVAITEIAVRDLPGQHTAVIRGRVSMQDTSPILRWLQETLDAVQRSGQQPAGMPFVRTHAIEGGEMEVKAAWPVAAPVAASGEVVPSSLPGGPAVVVTYLGPYEGLPAAHKSGAAWCREHGRELSGPPWESYFTDPREEPDPAKWRTDICYPLRA